MTDAEDSSFDGWTSKIGFFEGTGRGPAVECSDAHVYNCACHTLYVQSTLHEISYRVSFQNVELMFGR